MEDQHRMIEARAIAEALIPEPGRGPEWNARWDALEIMLSDRRSDQDLRDAYLANSGEAGDLEADVLAAACLVRNVDI